MSPKAPVSPKTAKKSNPMNRKSTKAGRGASVSANDKPTHQSYSRRLPSDDLHISSFQNMMMQFEEAARRLNIDPRYVDLIKLPRRSVIVQLPVQMDNGTFKMFTGYR